MIRPKLSIAIMAAVLIMSVAAPLALVRSTDSKLRTAEAAARQQAEELAQLTAENQRLSAMAGKSKPVRSPSDSELTELLRLRSEVVRLREQTNQLQKLSEDTRRIEAQEHPIGKLFEPGRLPSAEFEAEYSVQTVEAMKSLCRELPAALQSFANQHSNGTPEAFWELRSYFPVADGRKMPGLYTFNFVRDNGPKPEDELVLSEESPRPRRDGKLARVYGFRDGRAVEVTSEDGDFEAWEKQFLK